MAQVDDKKTIIIAVNKYRVSESSTEKLRSTLLERGFFPIIVPVMEPSDTIQIFYLDADGKGDVVCHK